MQTISLVWSMLKQGPNGDPAASKAIICVPSTLVSNWKAEFKKWLGCVCTDVVVDGCNLYSSVY